MLINVREGRDQKEHIRNVNTQLAKLRQALKDDGKLMAYRDAQEFTKASVKRKRKAERSARHQRKIEKKREKRDSNTF